MLILQILSLQNNKLRSANLWNAQKKHHCFRRFHVN